MCHHIWLIICHLWHWVTKPIYKLYIILFCLLIRWIIVYYIVYVLLNRIYIVCIIHIIIYCISICFIVSWVVILVFDEQVEDISILICLYFLCSFLSLLVLKCSNNQLFKIVCFRHKKRLYLIIDDLSILKWNFCKIQILIQWISLSTVIYWNRASIWNFINLMMSGPQTIQHCLYKC